MVIATDTSNHATHAGALPKAAAAALGATTHTIGASCVAPGRHSIANMRSPLGVERSNVIHHRCQLLIGRFRSAL